MRDADLAAPKRWAILAGEPMVMMDQQMLPAELHQSKVLIGPRLVSLLQGTLVMIISGRMINY